MVDAEEVTDQEELRFAKKQQWYVATASVTLNAAVIALLKGSQLRDCEPLVACLFIALVAGAGIMVLWQLQNHLCKVRRRSEREAKWHRETDVFYLLTFFVLAVCRWGGLLHLASPTGSTVGPLKR